MNTKLAPHWIPTHMDQRDEVWLGRWRPPMIKIVTASDNSVGSLDVALRCTPGPVIIRSHPISENWEHRGFNDDREYALTMARGHINQYRTLLGNADAQYGRLDRARLAIEGLNEPREWSDEPAELTAAYYAEFIKGAAGLGVKAVALNLGVGWPGNHNVQDAPPDWTPYEPVFAAVDQYGGWIATHEYWYTQGPRQNWGWWGGRLMACPWAAPWILTEVGIDAHVAGDVEYYGYKGLGQNEEEASGRFVAMLADYDQQLQHMPWVEAAFPYTYDFGSHEWATFDYRNGIFLDRLQQHIDWIRGGPVIERAWSMPSYRTDVAWYRGFGDGVVEPTPIVVPAEPGEEEPVTVELRVFEGEQERTMTWLRSQWGITIDDSLVREDAGNFRVSEIRIIQGERYVVKFGNNDSGNQVAFARSYPSAPNQWPNGVPPAGFALPAGAEAHCMLERASNQVEWTAGPGDIMGPDGGANLFWMPSHMEGSDVVRGVGTKKGQGVEIVFTLIPVGAVITPEPETEPEEEDEFIWPSYVQRWQGLCESIGGVYGLDPQVIGTLISIESSGQPDAISSAGAVGLMQVMPFEAGFPGRPSRDALLDPATNIEWGCRILAEDAGEASGDLAGTLGRYSGALNYPQALADYLAKFSARWALLWGTNPPSLITVDEDPFEYDDGLGDLFLGVALQLEDLAGTVREIAAKM